MNPFILAGIVFAAIGLVQEAIFESEKENKKPKLIPGPQVKTVKMEPQEPQVKTENRQKKVKTVTPASDG